MERIDTVKQFVDNVLRYGRDRWSGNNTPMFADGVNIDTLRPVLWRHDGREMVMSNFASQQNLMRTLVGLSSITGDDAYRAAAEAAAAYMFDNQQAECGLLRWGGHMFVDIKTLQHQPINGETHELKCNFPFYELMWQVDPGSAESNDFRPMWADGTDLTGHVFPRTGYYGSKGDPFPSAEAGEDILLAFARAFRLSGDQDLWETARNIAAGNGLGDIGTRPGCGVRPETDTANSNPVTILSLLELNRIKRSAAYIEQAEVVADNMVRKHFHEGFFIPAKGHINARFDALEPLALLALEAELKSTSTDAPFFSFGGGGTSGRHDEYGLTGDAFLWSATRGG